MSGYVFPVKGYNAPINLHWGDVSGGSDLFSPRGTPILNMQAGKVIESGWNSVGGFSVLVQGEDGNQYYYAHLDSASPVKVGQTIPEGTYLGPVGNTGDASNGQPHLHIGIGPDIKLGSDKYGGTGGDYDAVGLLNRTFFGQGDNGTSPITSSAVGYNLPKSVDYNDKESVKNYIRQAATARNIDPEIAVAIANGEGLNNYVGDNNSSFGPYQLHYGGRAAGGNYVSGLGDAFTKATGLDARDASTIAAQIDYSLDSAAQNGWGAWHAAPRLGIGPFSGIGKNAKPIGVSQTPSGDTPPNFNQNLPSSQYPQWLLDAARGGNSNKQQLGPFGQTPQSTYNMQGPIPGSQIMPYIPSIHGNYTMEPIPNTPIQQPGYDWTKDLTPMSFSPYNAPNATPNIMSRMSRPWSLYG